MGKIACCFGHRDVYKNISDILSEVIEDLIINKGVTTFWTGGMGEFDSRFGTAVNSFKRKYPDVTLTLIKPYFSNELNTNKEFYEYRYDGVYIPEELAGVHPKQAITKRNRWMVEKPTMSFPSFTGTLAGLTRQLNMQTDLAKRLLM